MSAIRRGDEVCPRGPNSGPHWRRHERWTLWCRAFPSRADLNADPNAGRQIYEMGDVIGEFVVARWGRAGLLDPIRGRGDVDAVSGVTPAASGIAMYA
ncbi:MAG: hypothetical protein ABI818_06525 [Acidobacteriota bacterium]